MGVPSPLVGEGQDEGDFTLTASLIWFDKLTMSEPSYPLTMSVGNVRSP